MKIYSTKFGSTRGIVNPCRLVIRDILKHGMHKNSDWSDCAPDGVFHNKDEEITASEGKNITLDRLNCFLVEKWIISAWSHFTSPALLDDNK